MTTIQVTLTDQEHNLLLTQAQRLGYNLQKFVKQVITKEARHALYGHSIAPIPMSKKAEKRATLAEKAYKTGKTQSFRSFRELLDS